LHKFENNWKSKTLENLEKDIWGDIPNKTNLIERCYLLRKKRLMDFVTEDLRIMIGQNIGLKFLVPLAIETLSVNILAEGDFYPGDLLQAVLASDKYYWNEAHTEKNALKQIVEANHELLKKEEPKLFSKYNVWKKK